MTCISVPFRPGRLLSSGRPLALEGNDQFCVNLKNTLGTAPPAPSPHVAEPKGSGVKSLNSEPAISLQAKEVLVELGQIARTPAGP